MPALDQIDSEAVVKQFIANVRRMRLDLGLSSAEVAERTDMDDCQMRRIERGRGNVTLLTAVRIALGLGVPLATLFTGLEFDTFHASHPVGQDAEWMGFV